MFLLSTNDTIIELVNEITKTIENNEFTVGIFLDWSKAFDTVAVRFTKLLTNGFRSSFEFRYELRYELRNFIT